MIAVLPEVAFAAAEPLLKHLWKVRPRRAPELEIVCARMEDGYVITLQTPPNQLPLKRVAVLVHGNGMPAHYFYHYQLLADRRFEYELAESALTDQDTVFIHVTFWYRGWWQRWKLHWEPHVLQLGPRDQEDFMRMTVDEINRLAGAEMLTIASGTG